MQCILVKSGQISLRSDWAESGVSEWLSCTQIWNRQIKSYSTGILISWAIDFSNLPIIRFKILNCFPWICFTQSNTAVLRQIYNSEGKKKKNRDSYCTPAVMSSKQDTTGGSVLIGARGCNKSSEARKNFVAEGFISRKNCDPVVLYCCYNPLRNFLLKKKSTTRV